MRWTHLYLISAILFFVYAYAIPVNPYIKTKKLRASNVRKKAIKHAEDTIPNFSAAGKQADHLLELQEVTKFLQAHHHNPSAACLKALKKTLNAKENIVMANADDNQHKGRVVNSHVFGRPHIPHTAGSRTYVDDHRQAIKQTAENVDRDLRSTECGYTGAARVVDQTKAIHGWH